MELITNILLDRAERKNVYRGVPLPPDRGKKSSPGFSRAWNAGKGIHGSLFLRRDGWTGEGINPSREISLNVIGSRPIGVVARKLSPPRQKLNGGQKSRLSSVHPLVIFSSIHRAGYLTDPEFFLSSPFPSRYRLSIAKEKGGFRGTKRRGRGKREANSVFSAAIRSRFGNELPADSRQVPCNYKLVPFSRGTGTVSIGSRLSRSCLVRTVYISDDNDSD